MARRLSFLIAIICCAYSVTGVGEDLDSEKFEWFEATSVGSRLDGPPTFSCETNINEQIGIELNASDVYLSMAGFFKRFDVSLPGFEKFFKKASDEERDHAYILMNYLNKRGGIVRGTTAAGSLPANVASGDWIGALEATKAALTLEKDVLKKLLAVHKCAEDNNDFHLQDFIESTFLTEQYDSIEELSNMVTKLRRLECGVGLHIYDQELLK